MDLVELLTSSSITRELRIEDHRVAPVPGVFTPVGVVDHHTASRGSSIRLLQHGHASLRGPLCNIGISRAGAVEVICDGRANDTGYGSSLVLDEVMRDIPPGADAAARGLLDDVGLSRWFYDIEVHNDGVGEPYPFAQIDALVRVNAALLAAHGWSTHRLRHHRQMTRRKIDMSYRGDVWEPTALHILSATNQGDLPMGATDDTVADLGHAFFHALEVYDGIEPRNTHLGQAILRTNATSLRVEAKLATLAGDVSKVRELAAAAATPAEVAQVVDSSLEALQDALVGLPGDDGEPVDRETIRLLLIELLEAAA